nr:TraR/DksA C4-type zinc finger protein [Desulfobulbaceae bacterium]
MEAKSKTELIKNITAAIAESRNTIENLKEKTKPISPDNAIGRISRMDAIGNKSINDAALRKAQERLTRLNYALTNMDRPDFGICIDCDAEIPLGRIMAVPESTLCVTCAEMAE